MSFDFLIQFFFYFRLTNFCEYHRRGISIESFENYPSNSGTRNCVVSISYMYVVYAYIHLIMLYPQGINTNNSIKSLDY